MKNAFRSQRFLHVLPQKQGLLRPLSSMDRATEALAWLGCRGRGEGNELTELDHLGGNEIPCCLELLSQLLYQQFLISVSHRPQKRFSGYLGTNSNYSKESSLSHVFLVLHVSHSWLFLIFHPIQHQSDTQQEAKEIGNQPHLHPMPLFSPWSCSQVTWHDSSSVPAIPPGLEASLGVRDLCSYSLTCSGNVLFLQT